MIFIDPHWDQFLKFDLYSACPVIALVILSPWCKRMYCSLINMVIRGTSLTTARGSTKESVGEVGHKILGGFDF